jgi:hypothetical protein
MSWPKKKISSNPVPEPDAAPVDNTAKAAPGTKTDKPPEYKRGKYNKSGKIATRKAFAATMNLNKKTDTKLP